VFEDFRFFLGGGDLRPPARPLGCPPLGRAIRAAVSAVRPKLRELEYENNHRKKENLVSRSVPDSVPESVTSFPQK